MPTRVETLDNGLKVILRPIPDTKALSTWVVYRIGSRNEVPGMTGSTHWVEHMLFKGGGKLGKGDIDKMISRLGGKMNAFTDTDYTMYFETIPASAMDTALMIESERMRNAAFDPKEVEAERTVVISEREGAENQPDFAVEEELWGLAFHVHPYHWTAIGYKQDLATLDREPLYRHYLRYYAPNNASLVLVGGFDPAVAMQHVREAFGALKPETPPDPPRRPRPSWRAPARRSAPGPGTSKTASRSRGSSSARAKASARGTSERRSSRRSRRCARSRSGTSPGRTWSTTTARSCGSTPRRSRREPAGPDRPRERRRPPVARVAVEPVHRVPRERPRRGRGGGLRPGRGRVHVAAPAERHAHDERGEARGPPRRDRGDARVRRWRGGPHVPGALHARDGGGDRPDARRVPRPPHVPAEGGRARPRRTPERRPHGGGRHARQGVPRTRAARVPEGPPVRAGPEGGRVPDPADPARGHRLVPRSARGPGGPHPRRDGRCGPDPPRRRGRHPAVAAPRRRGRTAHDPAPAAAPARDRIDLDAAQDAGRHRDRRAGRPPPARGLLCAQPGEPPLRADRVVRPPRAEPAGRARPRLLRVLEPRREDGGRDVVDLGGRESGEPREGDRVDPRRDGPPPDGALHAGRDPGREGQPGQFADRVARAERGGRVRVAPDGILRPRHGLPGALPRRDRGSDGGAGPGRRAEVLPGVRELDSRGRTGGPHPAPPVTRNYIIS